MVTRLENPSSSRAFEGRFALGWLSRLTSEQLNFVGLLLARRNNVQKLALDLNIAYNTARGRFEDIVVALGGQSIEDDAPSDVGVTRSGVRQVLERLASGEIDSNEADRLLRQ